MTFLHSFEPGGVERVALRLGKALQDRGNEVTVALGRTDGAMRKSAPDGLLYLAARRSVLAAPFESLWLVPHLVRMVRAMRPDILFCAGNTYTIVAVLARLWLGQECPPMVLKVSNALERPDFPKPVQWIYRLWLRFQAPFFERIVAMSEAMADEIVREMNVPPYRVHLVFSPALDGRTIPDDGAPPPGNLQTGGGLLYLGLGRLVWQKNFSLLIEAFAAMEKKDGDRLVLVGDGPERGKLERLAERLGLKDRIFFAGYQSDPMAWFEKTDVFVLSSRYEGTPAVLFEAMAAGCGIVATDCGHSMKELLDNGRLGLLAERADAGGLAAAMEKIREMPPETAAKRRMARRFTLEQAAPGYRDVFKAAMAAQGAMTLRTGAEEGAI